MNDKAKNIAGVGRQVGSEQSGFVILMGLLIVVLGSAAWYASVGGGKTEEMRSELQVDHFLSLEQVKERMFTYALLNPEIFDNGDVSNPGPGYFPCPDISGNGESDTGEDCSRSSSLYGIGWVPQKISSKHFSFLPTNQWVDNKRYWFAVDTRFMVDGSKYSYGMISNRFAPLTIDTPSLVDTTGASNCDVPPVSATCVAPLTLDGKGDIVMVLFYAGDSLAEKHQEKRRADSKSALLKIEYYLEQPSMSVPASSDGLPAVSGHFISEGNGDDKFNDRVIAITREEWNAVMLSRVAKDENGNLVPDLCEIDLDVENNTKGSWFDDCRHSGSAPPYPCTNISMGMGMGMGMGSLSPVVNLEGQGWRTALGCPL